MELASQGLTLALDATTALQPGQETKRGACLGEGSRLPSCCTSFIDAGGQAHPKEPGNSSFRLQVSLSANAVHWHRATSK